MGFRLATGQTLSPERTSEPPQAKVSHDIAQSEALAIATSVFRRHLASSSCSRKQAGRGIEIEPSPDQSRHDKRVGRASKEFRCRYAGFVGCDAKRRSLHTDNTVY